MNLLLLSIVLASLPLINWLFEYYFSKKDKQLHHFKKHFTCFYADLMLIPFNFFAAFAISINIIFIIVPSIFAFLGALVLYPHWARVHKGEENPSFCFDAKRYAVTRAGISHFVFQVVETVIIFVFLISSIMNVFSYWASAFLLLFILLFFIGSKKIHGKMLWSDVLVGVFMLILLAIKIIFFI